MKKSVSKIYLTCTLLICSVSSASQPTDQRIVGSWQGMREQSGKCQFLAWKSQFLPDGRFEISFFANKERTQLIQTERGTWDAKDGKNTLKTDGVLTPEVYLYTVLDDNTIKYVNTIKDPTADCQADYEFTEHRVRK